MTTSRNKTVQQRGDEHRNDDSAGNRQITCEYHDMFEMGRITLRIRNMTPDGSWMVNGATKSSSIRKMTGD